jgi:4-amino-4-deoxy-L-arabinose transferase-like glycosyltransferase
MDGAMVVEERTSVLAIVALVLSLICIIPGLGVLGAILAVVALVLISGSNGRVGGKGLAIAALVIGLLVSAVWVGGVMMVSTGLKTMTSMFGGSTASLLKAAEAGDFATARQQLDASVANSVTDADFQRFVTTYQSKLGTFTSVPTGVMELISAYGSVGQQMQGMQGQGNQGLFPLPVQFSKGWAVAALQLNPNGGGANLAPLNIELIAPDGTKILLYDPAANAAPPAPGATPATPQPGPSSGTP